ncbi:MAG TPA: AtpZ/AtpI family protein [Flavobacteriales bacterium]|nr:AtpZ/AtpI family protein [Flavobacteriales bacterium]
MASKGSPSRIPAGAKDYLRLSGIGLTMALYVAAFTLLGHWLDGFTGWKVPVLTILGALGGVAGAMLHLFKATRKP